ncbi:hypothetical protein CEXT_693741 [Caerostris extrusa]|uniref:Uncharacterized protein n=1 Tax=Caerostris extrusa TaxID=172846 RepID=A0AAV4Y1Y3_CAEEX|nr:hypothetical protein CEXT_693741 [Caerostris extrusa]
MKHVVLNLKHFSGVKELTYLKVTLLIIAHPSGSPSTEPEPNEPENALILIGEHSVPLRQPSSQFGIRRANVYIGDHFMVWGTATIWGSMQSMWPSRIFMAGHTMQIYWASEEAFGRKKK